MAKHRQAQKIGLCLGIAFGLMLIGFMVVQKRFLARGPQTPGHENLTCNQCHIPSNGTIRQQLQANVSYLLGNRKEMTDFALKPVEREACLTCHDRPDDRHPIYRFQEPRFQNARDELGVKNCSGCHVEHNGFRVSMPMDGCRHCHQELELKNDPIEPSHVSLILTKSWKTCIQCHDFHGNHRRETPKSLDDAIPIQLIQSYFQKGPSAYPGPKIHKAVRKSSK